MKVKILLFAQLRDVVDSSEIDLDVSGNTVRDAIDALVSLHPGLGVHVQRAQTALNEEYCGLDTALHAGCTLALIPPVSGGSW